VALVVDLVRQRSARRVLLAGGAFLDSLGLPEHLKAAGLRVDVAAELPAGQVREAFFAAEVGITGIDWLVAETGTAALVSRPDQPRSASLLPPIHIIVADRSQVVPDLFDLFAGLAGTELPSCLSLITGPSKTGDIELRLVTGVHGPGEVHLVLVQEA
jgi:L-lactate utilization protein LutC